MKIAYLLSGFARGYRETAPLLEKNVLRLLRAKHEVDIFISTWKYTDRGGYPEFDKNPEEELLKYYKNAKIEIEDNWSFKNRYVCDFYRRFKSWELMDKMGKQYDFVFRDRMDTVHPRIFPINSLESLDDQIIYFPKYIGDHHKDPFQDWTAYGHRKSMEKYFGVFNLLQDVDCQSNITSLMREHPKIYNPEWTLFAGLRNQNAKWRYSDYEVTPYDRHFGNRIHEIDVHEQNGEKFRISTTEYSGVKIPENVNERTL